MTGQDFADFAEAQCGNNGARYQASCNINTSTNWSAAFISYISRHIGLPSTLFSKCSKCRDIEEMVDVQKEFSWIQPDSYKDVPQPGDIIAVRWDGNTSETSNIMGIVTRYNKDANTVDFVAGDVGSTGPKNSSVKMLTLNRNMICIKGYIRYDWNNSE